MNEKGRRCDSYTPWVDMVDMVDTVDMVDMVDMVNTADSRVWVRAVIPQALWLQVHLNRLQKHIYIHCTIIITSAGMYIHRE